VRPITQTSTATGEGGKWGNCLQAAVASALELDLDQVPHFVQDHHDHGRHWWSAVLDFLDRHGMRLADADPEHPPAGELCLAVGTSPRGPEIRHAVLLRDGALAWDPHPSRDGLVDVQSAWALLPTAVTRVAAPRQMAAAAAGTE